MLQTEAGIIRGMEYSPERWLKTTEWVYYVTITESSFSSRDVGMYGEIGESNISFFKP